MEHSRALQLLTDYLRGGLDEPEHSGMAEHLAACAECAELAEVYGLLAEGDEAGHPASEIIVSHALRPEALESREAERVAAHVATCRLCAEEVRVTRRADEATRTWKLGSAAARISLSRPWSWGLPVIAAAAALLVAFLVASPPAVVAPGPTGYRAGLEEPVSSLLAPGEPLLRADCLLRWAGPEDARYDLRVATEDLSVLLEATDLARPEYLVPEQALAGLPSGSALLWQVTSALPDGKRLPSRTFVSRLR